MTRFYVIIDSQGHAGERLHMDVNPPLANMWISCGRWQPDGKEVLLRRRCEMEFVWR